MAIRYHVVNTMINSKPINIPIVENPNEGDSKFVKSPEWMIRLDKIVFSAVTGYETHTELFGWYSESGRFTLGDVSNQLFTSATLSHSDVVVIIPNGGYAADLQTSMNAGRLIERASLVHLGNVGQTKVKLQEIIHEQCRIQNFQQQLDRLVLHLQVTTKTDTHFVYDRSGQIKGQMVTSVNYAQNSLYGEAAASSEDEYEDDDDYVADDEYSDDDEYDYE